MTRLIVGLGNPEDKYTETRHNIGFMVVDIIARNSGINFEYDKKLNAEMGKVKYHEEDVILLKPQTFVNKSGETVIKAKNKFKIKSKDIVVIHDDLDIEFGRSKLSFGKGSGGHNGVESIINHLKTEKIWRLKIGIANSQLKKARAHPIVMVKKEAVGSFVLSKFTPEEKGRLSEVLDSAIDKIKKIS